MATYRVRSMLSGRGVSDYSTQSRFIADRSTARLPEARWKDADRLAAAREILPMVAEELHSDGQTHRCLASTRVRFSDWKLVLKVGVHERDYLSGQLLLIDQIESVSIPIPSVS